MNENLPGKTIVGTAVENVLEVEQQMEEMPSLINLIDRDVTSRGFGRGS